MEDGEAVEIVQRGLAGVEPGASLSPSMDGDSDADLDRLGMDENSIRGFWRGYRQFMQLYGPTVPRRCAHRTLAA